MSFTEVHFGKLKVVDNPENLPLEDLCKKICNEYGIMELDYHENWVNQLRYPNVSGGSKYYIANDKVYQMFEHEKQDEYDWEFTEKDKDGVIRFGTSFYNGGASLTEVIEAILKRVDK